MKFVSAVVALAAAVGFVLPAVRAVEDVWDYSVQVSSSVAASPARITLTWTQDTHGAPTSYTVSRKALSDTAWGAGVTLAGSATSYTDTGVTPGTAYEYRIVKVAPGYTGYGYIATGLEVALTDHRGTVVLVVDAHVAAPLARELARLEDDLVGDGWTVVRRDVSRDDSPANVKSVIKSIYAADPTNVRAVFLFGHVPVPYSGNLFPDGHPDHQGAWPADVYYGDMDGSWTDSTVDFTETLNANPADAARLSNHPGDGKFDQTALPSAVELEVGRVDLANMPGRTADGRTTLPGEIELLRRYLEKDHAFRHRISNTTRRAILGDYFGTRGGEAFAASGFRSFAPLVGAANIRNLNLEFNGRAGVWLTEASREDYLLAYSCGPGTYTTIAGIGTREHNDGHTTDFVAHNVRGVFNLLYGSWLGDWDTEDNMLRAPLATDYGLVSAWSGRPHWFIHHVGIGETIGFSARATQNNRGVYQTQINSCQNRIHVALMGDPTLRLHPVVPAANLTGTANGAATALSWTPSSDTAIVGYHVYRRTNRHEAFTRLTDAPITGTSFIDNASLPTATYMVRAVKLESTTSGSYYNPSQGIFWSTGVELDANAPVVARADHDRTTVRASHGE
jgi:hypothetical protein